MPWWDWWHGQTLVDKTYMQSLGSYGTGVYGDPRNVLVTARYRF